MSSPQIVATVARELSLPPQQVANTLALFDEGNTLPFIARYRKEATAGLDEVQLRDVRDRAQYLTELDDRRAAILKSIAEQGKLDATLQAAIDKAETKLDRERHVRRVDWARRARDRTWSRDLLRRRVEREQA